MTSIGACAITVTQNLFGLTKSTSLTIGAVDFTQLIENTNLADDSGLQAHPPKLSLNFSRHSLQMQKLCRDCNQASTQRLGSKKGGSKACRGRQAVALQMTSHMRLPASIFTFDLSKIEFQNGVHLAGFSGTSSSRARAMSFFSLPSIEASPMCSS